jgi:hypothetical protein
MLLNNQLVRWLLLRWHNWTLLLSKRNKQERMASARFASLMPLGMI